MTSPDDPFAAPPPGAGAPPPYAPPPPGYGAAPGYGPYGPPPTPQTDSKAIAVLVLAVCSFVVFPVIPAIVALVLAPGASRDIAASGGRRTGEGLVRAGRIVAWINLVLAVGFVLMIVLIFGLFGLAVTA